MVRFSTSVSLLAAVVSVNAQSSSIGSTEVPCAQTCLDQYFGADVNYGCAAEDTACGCSSVQGFTDLFCCIAQTCDPADIVLAASNAISLCSDYNVIPTIPDASQCPGLSATSEVSSSSPTAAPTASESSSNTESTSTPTPANEPNGNENTSKSSGGLSMGAKAGIGAGTGVVGVGLMVAVVLFFFCRRRNTNKNPGAANPEMHLSKGHPSIQDPYAPSETPAPSYNQFELDDTAAEKGMAVQSHELEVGEGKHELDVSEAARSPQPQGVLSHGMGVSDASYASPKSSETAGVNTVDSRFTDTQSNAASYELE